VGQTSGVTSALLFVALLVVVDLSYRRWMRRSIARRRVARQADREIVLDGPDTPANNPVISPVISPVINMPTRGPSTPDGRRDA
jgi:hypothetical protein